MLRLERVTGIEPALSAWEADVLPLNYTRTSGNRGRSDAAPVRGFPLVADYAAAGDRYAATGYGNGSAFAHVDCVNTCRQASGRASV